MTQRRRSSQKHSDDAIAPEMPYEEAYAALQAIAAELERPDLPMEDSLTLYARGMRLAAHCQTLLESAELRVQQIEAQADGALHLHDIEIETE